MGACLAVVLPRHCRSHRRGGPAAGLRRSKRLGCRRRAGPSARGYRQRLPAIPRRCLMLIDNGWFMVERPTPQTLIEAVMYSIRERGLAALREPETLRRLDDCD